MRRYFATGVVTGLILLTGMAGEGNALVINQCTKRLASGPGYTCNPPPVDCYTGFRNKTFGMNGKSYVGSRDECLIQCEHNDGSGRFLTYCSIYNALPVANLKPTKNPKLAKNLPPQTLKKIHDKVKKLVQQGRPQKSFSSRIQASPGGVRGDALPAHGATVRAAYTFGGQILSTAFHNDNDLSELMAVYRATYRFQGLTTFSLPFFVQAARPGDWLVVILNDTHIFERRLTSFVLHKGYLLNFPVDDLSDGEGMITVIVAGTGGRPGSKVFLPQSVDQP